MLRLLADENVRRALLRGLLRLNPAIDLLTVQDAGLRGLDDAAVLEWAAPNERVVITHDYETLLAQAYERVVAGLPMPGVIAVPWEATVSLVLEDPSIVVEASLPGEWEGQICYLPL